MKVIVAYSGGLDTSVIVKWVKEKYNAEVIGFCADVGQEEELNGVEAKAIRTGATYTYPAGAEVQDDLEKSTVTEFKGKLTRPGNVRFFEREAAPCFDLGKEYIVKRLRLRHGRNPRPDSWELQAGTDGATFRTIASGKPEWTGDRWAEIDLVPVKARFIRIVLRYPDGKGGYLDEIELYGSEPPIRK